MRCLLYYMKGTFSGCLLALLLLILPIFVSSPSAETLTGESQVQPWSGYWWPLQKGEIVKGYQGHPSPTEKYDLYTTGNFPGAATSSALNQWYDPDVPYWYGFCNGWANAAILEAYEINPSATNGLFLSVGDKKGLLATFHSKDLTISENCRSSPAPFHRYLLEYLGEYGQSIAANLDNSGEFWSYPIFKYEMDISRGKTYDHVICTITYADDQGFSPDYEGTVAVEKQFEYRLFKDGDGNYIGGNSSESGEWVGASVEDHPVLVWVPIGINQAENFIDYDTIKKMAMTFDDESEGKELVPGHHLIVVYPDDEDSFFLKPQVGEKITIEMAFDRQSTFGEGAEVILKRNNVAVVDKAVTYTMEGLEIVTENSEDRYEINFSAAENNERAVFIHLYVDYKTDYENWFYGFPSTSYWFGLAALPSEKSNITAQVVGENGMPALSGLKKNEIGSESRWLQSLETYVCKDYFIDNPPKAVKISSSSASKSLMFCGNDNLFWGTTGCETPGLRKMVVPWLTHWFNHNESGELYLANHNQTEVSFLISYFDDNGMPYSSYNVSLKAGEINSYGAAKDYPGGASLNGWALIEADNDGIYGAVHRTEESQIKDQLPLLTLGDTWQVPHLAIGDGWETIITLFNPNPKASEVVIWCNRGLLEPCLYSILLPAYTKAAITVVGSLWNLENDEINSSWLQIESDHEIAGFYSYRNGDDSAASSPFVSIPRDEIRWLPHIASDDSWWTGIALVNYEKETKNVILYALSATGEELEKVEVVLSGREKKVALAESFFAAENKGKIAAIRLDQGSGIGALGLYGNLTGASRITGFNW